MRLSTVTLVRDGATLTLQGMIHIGTYALYRQLQKELDDERAKGASVFYELTMTSGEPTEGLSEDAKSILDALKQPRITADRLPKRRTGPFVATQLNCIEYHLDSDINADVSLEQLIGEADVRGTLKDPRIARLLRVMQLLRKLSGIESKTQRDITERLVDRRPLSGGRLLLSFLLGCFARIAFLMPYEVAEKGLDPAVEDIILDFRNEVAVDIIESLFAAEATERGFVHYGEAHIPGLLTLLESHDWEIQQHVTRELRPFLFTK